MMILKLLPHLPEANELTLLHQPLCPNPIHPSPPGLLPYGAEQQSTEHTPQRQASLLPGQGQRTAIGRPPHRMDTATYVAGI